MKKANIEAEVVLKDFTPEGSTAIKTYAEVYVIVNGLRLKLNPSDTTAKIVIKQYAVENAK